MASDRDTLEDLLLNARIDAKTVDETADDLLAAGWLPPAQVVETADDLAALRSLTIYGAADDCLEVEGYIDDEFDALNGATLILTTPDDARLIVAAEFCPDAQWRSHGEGDSGWVLQVHHADPKWTYPIRLTFRPDRDIDPAIELRVPEGTTITKWDDE